GEAVARALAADGRPVVLADIADNTGGGAAGDTTEILRELLRVGARPATVACIWDAEAVQACARAGVGATVTVDVGGKVDPSHGAPVRVTGRVRTLGDGRFVHKGPMLRGLEGRLGPTAVLDVNDLKIILISLRWQTLDPEMLRVVGIDPAAERILVVKSSVHYRAAFEPRPPQARGARQEPGAGGEPLARGRGVRARRQARAPHREPARRHVGRVQPGRARIQEALPLQGRGLAPLGPVPLRGRSRAR